MFFSATVFSTTKNTVFYWDNNNRFKPKTTVTTLVTRGALLYIGGRRSAALSLLGERGGAAGAFAAEAALGVLRGGVQRPCHGPHDIHGDGPGVVLW